MATYQVCVARLPADRDEFVNALRLAGRLGLQQAHDLTSHFDRFARSVLVAGVDLAVAEHLAAALREAGAEIDVEASALTTPMLCVPQVNAKFTWGRLRHIKQAS